MKALNLFARALYFNPATRVGLQVEFDALPEEQRDSYELSAATEPCSADRRQAIVVVPAATSHTQIVSAAQRPRLAPTPVP